MDYETMRRLRESDPGKFTGIGREKGAGNGNLAGVNPGGQQVPNARLASELRNGPPADDPLARIPGYYDVGPSTDPGHPNYVPAHKRQSPARTPGSQAGRRAAGAAPTGGQNSFSSANTAGMTPTRRRDLAMYDDEFNEDKMTYTREFAGQRRCAECNKWGVKSQYASSEWAKEVESHRHCKDCAKSKWGSAGKFALAAAAIAAPPPKLKDDRVSSTSTSTLRKSKTGKAIEKADAKQGAKQGGKGAKGEKTSPLPEIRRSSLFPEGYSVATQMKSKFHKEDMQRSVPRPKPLTVDEFKRTKEYRDVVESDTLVANTLREVREREENTKREIEHLKQKRQEQRRFHVDTVESIRADADRKLRGAGPLNLLNKGGKGGSGTSSTPNKSSSGSPATYKSGESPEERADRLAAEEVRARLSASADPSRGPIYDPARSPVVHGAITPEERRRRTTENADRKRREFAEKVHAVEVASPNGRESFDAVYAAIESPEIQKKISPPKPQRSPAPTTTYGNQSPGTNLRPRALDTSGGYDSSPDSLNGSHRSPGRVSFKEDAPTPSKNDLIAKMKGMLAEAKAPEERKKVNAAVNVWTDASRGLLPAINPLSIPGTRGILKTPSSGTGSLGDSPPKEEYYCARCGVKQPDPYANYCGGCGTAVDLKKLDSSKKKQQKAGPMDTSDIKLPVGPGGRQLSYRGSIEHELRAIEARDTAKSLTEGSKWKLAQDRYNAGDAFGNVHRLPSYLAATDDHGELYREEEDKIFRATNKYGFSLDMYGPPKKTPKRVARSPQTYHRMHNKAFGSYLYVDRWGDTGAEERVNRIQHSDKRRCVSCGLFGKQIRFSDREWDASAPKCRSCEVAPRDAVTGPKLPRAKHFMRPTAANQNFAGAYDDDNYSEDNFYQSLYGTSEQERDPFDDLPSAGKPKERVRPVSGKHKPAWNNVTITGRGFSENKFKAMSRPNPQWNKSSEVTPATKQSSRRAPAEQLIDFDGAPKSKKDSPGGGVDGPPSPGAGLWYGSSVSSPQKAYQVLVDACKLKEEDCFLYLSKRYGRYSEASRGREARGEALAHLKDFLQKAEQKGLVPDWWSNENTSELCRAAQVPNNPYHLKLIKIGEPMTTATEIATRWGLAGTESLRDLHFDIDPSPWHGYRAPTPPDNRQSQYAFKSGETPLDKKIAEVLGKAPHGARKDAASSRQSDRPKWEHDTPLYDQYGDPIDQDGDDGYGYDEDDGEYSDGGTFYPYDDYNDYEDDGEYSHGGTFYPYEDPFDDYEVASMVKPPSEYHARPRAPEPKQFDDGFIAGMGMKQADDDFIAGMGMKQAPGPGAAVVKSSPAKSPKSLPSDADLRNIGIDTSTMSAEEKRALGLDGSDPAKAAALAEAVDRLRIESGPSKQTSPAAEKGTKGGTISDWAGKDTGTSNKPMSERKKAAAAVWDDISSDEEDPRVSDGRWKPKPMLVGKNFLEQQLAERTHWEPLKPGFITSGAPPTPPMKSKQAEMARMWRNKTQAKKGGKVNMKEFGVMAMLGAGGKGVKRDKALSAFMSSKKNENADTAGKSTGTRGGGFKKFGQAVLQQSNAGPVTENWSPKRTGVSFADDSNSTHSKVLDLTGKAQAPLVNNALVLSGRSRWGTYEEDDTYANAVKSALGALGVEIRGGHRRGGRNVSVESHRAAVLLGVGGTGTDTLGESANFLTDPEWLRSLLEFVSKGGVLVVQGDGEPAERVFSLFNLPWRFAPSGRERADFSWNRECLVTSRDASSEHWRGWNGGFRVYNARSALLENVETIHAVFTRPDAFGEIEAEESLLAAVAAATYGDGLVCFVGDDNGEEETVDLVARLATTPRVG